MFPFTLESLGYQLAQRWRRAGWKLDIGPDGKPRLLRTCDDGTKVEPLREAILDGLEQLVLQSWTELDEDAARRIAAHGVGLTGRTVVFKEHVSSLAGDIRRPGQLATVTGQMPRLPAVAKYVDVRWGNGGSRPESGLLDAVPLTAVHVRDPEPTETTAITRTP